MLDVAPILPLPAPPTGGDLGPLPPSQFPAEDEKQNDYQNEVVKPSSVPTHTWRIGIIHPPPDIRNIIDTTSHFVAKVGPELEKRIVAENAGNVKFNFLIASDPYHAYYQHKLSEFRSQPLDSAVPETAFADGVAATAEKPYPSVQFRLVCKAVEPPEAEQYTVRLPEGITGEELDIIKLTAQLIARNGKSFLTGLTSREMKNPQFHFLKPTHNTFMLFTALADAYSKVLMPPKCLTDKIQQRVVDRTTVLERCLLRLKWEKSQEQAWQKAKHEVEQERLQMAMIDWHDFVVVECIDFDDDDDEDDKLQLVRVGENGDDQKNEVAAMDEDECPMRIVKNWKRPEEIIQADRESSNFVVSPITRELIPTSEMSEHIRISLVDPKYKEQKERMLAKIRGTTLAQDDEISRNIVGLARTRPDIFGTTEEEVSNAVKAEIEKKTDEQPKQVIWDGHTRSIGRTAIQAMSQSIGGEDQYEINNNDGRPLPGPAALPPPGPGVPLVRPLPPPPNLALNIPRFTTSSIPYSAPKSTPNMIPFQHRPPLGSANQMVRPPPPLMQMPLGQQQMMNCPSMQSLSMPGPPPSVAQFTPVGAHRPFSIMPPMPQGMLLTPPPPTEAPPPPPDEPEQKRQKFDDSSRVPEDQFLAQHPGPIRINVSVPSVDEGNLKGKILEISMQSLSETVGSLKEKISAEIQLPPNKQKLSGKAGFLKDNLTLVYYNVGNGVSLSLSLRERGGRKR